MATAITIAALTALTPTVTCSIGILLQRQDVRDLRAEQNKLAGDMRAEQVRLSGDMRAEMVNLRNQVHADLLMIHERVAVVESKNR